MRGRRNRRAVNKDPELRHVLFDIYWDEVAQYVVATPESVKCVASMVTRSLSILNLIRKEEQS
jgi:hypothetical protein